MCRNGDAGVAIQDSDGNEIIGNVAHLGVRRRRRAQQRATTAIVRGNDVRFNPSGVDRERRERQR